MSQSHAANAEVVAPLWSKDLGAAGALDMPWLWHGYIASGQVTLLASQWKAGKTTLLSVLLQRMKGGGKLAGQMVRAGKALVVSEEPAAMWGQRRRKFDFAEHVCWLCRPFRGKPSDADWRRLVGQIAEMHGRFGFDLVVLDPLAAVLPGRDENCAGQMINALGELSALTERGLAVLLLHHTRKAAGPEGHAARGSGALAGFVDILIEMHWYGRATQDDRRRRLMAWSRHDETPRRLVIELNDDGTDYTALGDVELVEFSTNWQLMEKVLKRAKRRMTRQAILGDWPEGHPKPHDGSLCRWLTRAVEAGQVCRGGLGRRNDPYRYWLPGKLEEWKSDPWNMESTLPLPTFGDYDDDIVEEVEA